MTELFRTILTMSLSGSAIAVLLFLSKPFIKDKISKTIQYYMWVVVLLLLLVPISFEMPQSERPSTMLYNVQPITIHDTVQRYMISAEEEMDRVSLVSESTNHNDIAIYDAMVPSIFTIVMPFISIIFWPLGTLIFFSIHLFGYFRFKRFILKTCVAAEDSDLMLLKQLTPKSNVTVYRSAASPTPMILGIFSPKIILPDREYSDTQLRNIFTHELIHLKRFDIAIKWLVLIANGIHWFNPAIYFVRKEIDRACELSCDECVIKTFSNQEKQSYGETLLNVAEDSRMPIGALSVTMCEEKKMLKTRLLAIMGYGKKSKYALAITIALLVFVMAGAVYACAKSSTNLAQEVDLTTLKEFKDLAVMPEIDYASDERVIFHSLFGLFIYDIKSEKLTNTIDLAAIDSNYMQGSVYTEIKVSNDGKTVYIDNIGDGYDNFMYEYNIKNNRMEKVPIRDISDTFVKGSIFDKGYDVFEGALSTTIAQIDTERFAYVLIERESLPATEYRIVVYNEKTKEFAIYSPFYDKTVAAPAITPIKYDLAKIMKHKAKYVGDASNTGTLASLLPVPRSGFIANFTSLQTTTEPYGVTLYYEATKVLSDSEVMAEDLNTSWKNAFILFCMIDNLGEVRFAYRMSPTEDGRLDESKYTNVRTYKRDNDFLTFGDLSIYGKDIEQMENILIEVDKAQIESEESNVLANQIGEILDKIAIPSDVSNPAYYVSANREEADKITTMGDEALPHLLGMYESGDGLKSAVANILALEIKPNLTIVSQVSPDGKYKMKTQGINMSITQGGLYPVSRILLTDSETGSWLWVSPGCYTPSFIWSDDSKHVAINSFGRTWGEAMILDVSNFNEIALPDVESVRKNAEVETTVRQENPNLYFTVERWLDNQTVVVKFEWMGLEDNKYMGSYNFDIVTDKMYEIEIEADIHG